MANGRQAPDEMRLIHTDDGWATVLDREIGHVARPFAAIIAMMMAIAVAVSVMGGPPLLLGLVPLVLLGILLVPTSRWRRVALRPHGIEIGTLLGRAAPGLDQVRAGTDAPLVLPIGKEASRSLPFSEMTDLGHTDYSIWFQVGDERVEVTLEHTTRADIVRLHDEIRGVWKRYRDALQDTEDEARARRARLSEMQGSR